MAEGISIYSMEKIVFMCPSLEREVESTDVEIDGGCSGHFGEYDYCYCDSPHLLVKCECTDKKGKAYYHSLYP